MFEFARERKGERLWVRDPRRVSVNNSRRKDETRREEQNKYQPPSEKDAVVSRNGRSLPLLDLMHSHRLAVAVPVPVDKYHLPQPLSPETYHLAMKEETPLSHLRIVLICSRNGYEINHISAVDFRDSHRTHRLLQRTTKRFSDIL